MSILEEDLKEQPLRFLGIGRDWLMKIVLQFTLHPLVLTKICMSNLLNGEDVFKLEMLQVVLSSVSILFKEKERMERN